MDARLYLVSLVLGMTSLIAWNSWITAHSVFAQRLAGTPLESTFEARFSSVFNAANLATLSLLMAAPLVVNYGALMRPFARARAGVVLNGAVFALACLLMRSDWAPVPFFTAVLVCVGVSAVAAALMASVMAVLSVYEPIYTQAASVGMGIAGLVPSFISFAIVWSSSSDPDHRIASDQQQSSSITPFLVSILLSVLSIFGLRMLPPPSSVSRHRDDDEVLSSDAVSESSPLVTTATVPNAKNINLAIKEFTASLFINFVVTLAVFPALAASIKSVRRLDANVPHMLQDNVFVALMFIIFNLGDLTGKFMPGFPRFYITNKDTLLRFSIARIVFIPLLLLCNVPSTPENPAMFPRLFGDFGFMTLIFTMGLTNGWVASNTFMRGPREVVSEGAKAQGLASDSLVWFMTAGLAVGGIASGLFV
ncbi:nucleoside transporter-domain-containing protein [Chytriomyces cf. hyalinus JEL632]|nr:nucleoside transporter-domain-containing protein [Chytriomyces cf. hyalinus JEL632]